MRTDKYDVQLIQDLARKKGYSYLQAAKKLYPDFRRRDLCIIRKELIQQFNKEKKSKNVSSAKKTATGTSTKASSDDGKLSANSTTNSSDEGKLSASSTNTSSDEEYDSLDTKNTITSKKVRDAETNYPEKHSSVLGDGFSDKDSASGEDSVSLLGDDECITKKLSAIGISEEAVTLATKFIIDTSSIKPITSKKIDKVT